MAKIPSAPAPSLSDADVFSRGSLQLTYNLLRKQNPALALVVRNIIQGATLEYDTVEPNNKNTDHFQVTLDSFQVRAVVEGLMSYGSMEPEASPQAGIMIMAKTLIEDWMALAHKMISELPAEQKP